MTDTRNEGALAPVATTMTVAQAIETVGERLDAMVEAQLAEYEKEIAEVSSAAAFLDPVIDDQTAENTADEFKKANRLAKDLDEARKILTRRLDALKDRMKGPFDKKIAICAGAAARHKENARPYLEEKSRKAEADRLAALEVRRKAEEQARKEQEEARREADRKRAEAAEALRKETAAKLEAQRLEEEREKAKSKKKRDELDAQLAQARLAVTEATEAVDEKQEAATEAANEAAIADEVAEAVAAPVDMKKQNAGVRSIGGASLGLVAVWQHKIVDEALLPIEAWQINHDWIAAQYANEEARKRIADANGTPQVPGCLIFKGSRVGGR